MKNLSEMIGSIKKIKTVNTTGEKVIDVMITDYTYNPNATINKQHKLDYISITGNIGSIYVNDKTTYSDIITNEHTKKYLMLIKESIQRRKVAYERYLQERKNIEALTIELLKDSEVLTKESFKKALIDKFDSKKVKLLSRKETKGCVVLSFAIKKDVSLDIALKKHYIKDIRLNSSKYTGKSLNELNFISAKDENSLWVNIEDENTYNNFIEKYKVLDFANENLKKFLEDNNLSFSSGINTTRDNDNHIYVDASHILSLRQRKDKLLLNNDTVNIIINLSDFIL